MFVIDSQPLKFCIQFDSTFKLSSSLFNEVYLRNDVPRKYAQT